MYIRYVVFVGSVSDTYIIIIYIMYIRVGTSAISVQCNINAIDLEICPWYLQRLYTNAIAVAVLRKKKFFTNSSLCNYLRCTYCS